MCKLDQRARSELLHFARESIKQHLLRKTPPHLTQRHDRLLSPSGAFVTLRKSGQLRGCIGSIATKNPLPQTIRECAVAAAVDDPRFPPLEPDELDELSIEISLLSPPQSVDDIEDICIGRHGVLVSQGPRRGLLLPQVATENHWDRKTFLEHACLKAGLPSDAWKHSAHLKMFSAEVFAEGETLPPPP